ncbi:hypothetical protein ACQ4PT_020084 [Festuca glaucescens]
MQPPGTAMMDIDLGAVRAVRVLGRGAMGTVFLVAGPTTEHYALKVFDKRRTPAARGQEDAARRARWEVSVLSRLAHPHLPSLLGRAETPELLAWAMPYCAGGDLNDLRRAQPDRVFSPRPSGSTPPSSSPRSPSCTPPGSRTATSSPRMSSSAPTATSEPAVAASSSGQEPRNLAWYLNRSDGGVDHLKKAKSARASTSVGRSKQHASFSSAASAGGVACERSFSFVGTEEYVAPEVVRGDGHEFSVDWWALGVLAYEMAFGRTPFRGRNRRETFRNVLLREPEFTADVQRRWPDFTDLILRLLDKDPARRLGFSGGADEVRAHPFFAGVAWELLGEVSRPPYIPPPADEVVACQGFGVVEYFQKLHQPPPQANESPESLPEF